MEDENVVEFTLPEEYKEVQAVHGCKSVADLCKRIVDNESFIGKLKSERAMPTANDGEEVWNSFFEKTKAIAETQDWADVDVEFAKIAKGAGLVKQQTKPILDFIKAQEDKAYDTEEFETKKKEMFKGREVSLNRINSLLSKLDTESIDALNSVKNDQLLSIYKVLGEVADKMAVEEQPTPPATTVNTNTSTVFKTDGKLDADNLSKMHEELLAVPNVPNKQELKDAIFKKYGYK